MKPGDKILCIKDLIRKNDKHKYIVVLKNKKYTILNINLDLNKDDNFIITTSENGLKNWSLTKNTFSDYFKFSDYFITEKQIRKLKIEKLNETRK